MKAQDLQRCECFANLDGMRGKDTYLSAGTNIWSNAGPIVVAPLQDKVHALALSVSPAAV